VLTKPLGIPDTAGLFLVVIGGLMVFSAYRSKGGGPDTQADDPITRIIDKLFATMSSWVSKPDRWGFILIMLGILLFIGVRLPGAGTSNEQTPSASPSATTSPSPSRTGP
jgi:hypothetical protein